MRQGQRRWEKDQRERRRTNRRGEGQRRRKKDKKEGRWREIIGKKKR